MIEVSLSLPIGTDFGAVVRRLEANEVPAKAIRVLTRTPLPPSAIPHRRSRMSRIGVIGAVMGFSGAIGGLTAMTLSYRLHTGGMPLVAPFPVGVITYEMTLLSSILAMLATLLIGGRLFPGRRVPKHPELRHDEGIVSVLCGDVSAAERARQVLNRIDSDFVEAEA